MTKIAALAIIVTFCIIASYIEHVKAIKCYQQLCWRQGRRWYCKHPDDGDDLEVGKDQVCTEQRNRAQVRIHRKSRNKQEFFLADHELALKVDKKGYACDRVFCYCNTDLCNTKVHVPKNFELGFQWRPSFFNGVHGSN